jgi:hypothetical protein
LTLDFRSPIDPEQLVEAALFIQVFPPAQAPSINPLDDDIRPAPDRDLQVVRANFGLLPIDGSPEVLRFNQRAVVQTATLSLERVRPAPSEVWRGRLQGELRSATAFDRARPGDCADWVYDPTWNRCMPIEAVRVFLGCPLDSSPPDDPGGSVAFGSDWTSVDLGWSPRSVDGGEGECGAIRTPTELILRARTTDWFLEIDFPNPIAVADDVGFQTVPIRLWRSVSGRESTPLFEVDLDPDPDRVIDGQLWIDGFNDGADGRIFAWIQGVPRAPP